jgi:hypothetical protein
MTMNPQRQWIVASMRELNNAALLLSVALGDAARAILDRW